ncbi:copper transporter [Saccharopolyspora sp. CA-218241]|uniref:copper transporter n=1 Tax=Saccharopolyspora sp. CA-218241 TaxID=3240027 RepID=UPI003D9826E7
MISMRGHVVSITAVFLALALGVVLGSTSVSERLLTAVAGDAGSLREQVDELRAERAVLQARLADADGFSAAVGPRAVSGLLDGGSVVLISTPDVGPEQREQVRELLGAAGAEVTGALELTGGITDPSRVDQLRRVVTELLPAGAQLPTAADPGTLAGALVAPLALVDPADGRPRTSGEERAAAFAGLATGGFLTASADLRPAQQAVVLTGGRPGADDAEDRAITLARFTTQLDAAGGGAVLAGAGAVAGTSVPVGAARADPSISSVVSTVDNLDAAAGRVAVVLALREQRDGRAGHYGVAANAQGPVPDERG